MCNELYANTVKTPNKGFNQYKKENIQRVQQTKEKYLNQVTKYYGNGHMKGWINLAMKPTVKYRVNTGSRNHMKKLRKLKKP